MTEAEWLASGMPILLLENELGWPSQRKLRLFVVACCRRIVHLLPEEASGLVALETAERYAEGKARRADLSPFQTWRTPGEGAARTYGTLRMEMSSAAFRWLCETSRRLYAGQAAPAAACAVAYAAILREEPYAPPAQSRYHRAWAEAEDGEVGAQLALVREVLGDPFGPTPARPGPLTGEIHRIAAAAYTERLSPSCHLDPVRLSVLADALEEAGCADGAILGHLRSPGPHVRGCWALDLVLNKD